MKKGLLSLLAVALTVVSCQNYDDQFASLTDQITTLSTTVAGLTTIKDQVTALQQTVNGLATTSALEALAGTVGNVATGVDANADAIADNATNATNNAAAAAAATASATAAANAAGAAATAAGTAATAAGAAVADVAAQVESVQASLTAILADLENVATAADLATISATLAIVQADVKEILAGSATINQDITINNAATLEYAETLVGTATDDPNVIVNGQVTINMTNIASGDLARVNAVAAKLATILGDGGGAKKGLVVTSDDALSFTSLTFIDDDVEIHSVTAGSDSAQDLAALRTISGGLKTNYSGANDFSQITSIGAVTISNSTSATSVIFGDTATIVSIDDDVASLGVVDFPNAMTVSLGIVPVTDITADKASSIQAKMTTTAGLAVDADLATTITFDALTTATGLIDIDATSATAINLGALTTGTALTITGTSTTDVNAAALTGLTGALTITDADDVNLGLLASVGGLITVGANTSDFSALTHIVVGGDSIGGTAVTLTALAAHSTGTLTLPDATAVLAPVLVNASTLTAPSALTVELKSSAQADLVVNAATSINLTEQAVNFTIGAATDYPALTSLTVTGKDVTGVTTTAVAITAATTLTTVNAGGELASLSVTDAGPTTVVTTGNITSLSLTGSSIAAVTLGHTFIEGDNAVDMTITGTALSSLDMSQVAKVKAITITGNGKLTSIVGPSSSTLPEAGTTGHLASIGTNSLTAVYTERVAEIAATETTGLIAAIPATLTSASVSSILTWWGALTTAVTAAASPSIDVENVTVGTAAPVTLTNAFANDTDNVALGAEKLVGVIDEEREIAIVQ